MKQELKDLLVNKRALRDLLECSDVHAWRLWNGKTNLSKTNEKLIRLSCKASSK